MPANSQKNNKTSRLGTKSKKDKVEIIQALVAKLIDENGDVGGAAGLDENLFAVLDEDELQILEELLDKVEFYVEVGGPILIIIIPMFICWIR